jgi:hypothetical protein
MPDTVVEKAARHLITALRVTHTPYTSPWDNRPDAAIVAPLVNRWANATADLLEYFVDTEGGIDGVAAMAGLLHASENLLPESLVPTVCPCPIHSPEDTESGYASCVVAVLDYLDDDIDDAPPTRPVSIVAA